RCRTSSCTARARNNICGRRFGRSGALAKMGSVRQLGVGAMRRKYCAQDETEISREAKLLVDQHGRDADIVAAKRADALLCEGKTSEGTQWLEIFRSVAMLGVRGVAAL
ncbi:MAG TPA: hypothetical protein VG324_25370, partial [Blastocatellia bacterium]|nr:hypothetical protein [Blastocatellia bacterium]